MPGWLRNMVMIVVLVAWLAVVAVSLVQQQLPDYRVLGIPAALVLALSPALRRGKKNDDEEDDE